MGGEWFKFWMYCALGMANALLVCARLESGNLHAWNALNLFAMVYCAVEMALL